MEGTTGRKEGRREVRREDGRLQPDPASPQPALPSRPHQPHTKRFRGFHGRTGAGGRSKSTAKERSADTFLRATCSEILCIQ